MPAVCEHGVSAHDGRYRGMWAGNLDQCGCCGTEFPYMNSSVFTIGAREKRVWRNAWTAGLCAECGGRYEERSEPPGWVPHKPAGSMGELTAAERRVRWPRMH